MSYPPSSPDGALIQIALAIGRMEAEIASLRTDILSQIANHTRALDTLIRILQASMSSQPVPAQQRSRRSMLGPIAEKIGGKISADLAMKLLWRLLQVAIPYLLPWAIVLWGLAKGLLKFLGLF